MIVKPPLFDRPLGQRDLRAVIAVWASIGGAVSLTAYVILVTFILWKGGWEASTDLQRIDWLAWLALCALAIVGLVITGLGFAINRRTFKGAIGTASFETSGGSEELTAPTTFKTTVTQETTVPPPQTATQSEPDI